MPNIKSFMDLMELLWEYKWDILKSTVGLLGFVLWLAAIGWWLS